MNESTFRESARVRRQNMPHDSYRKPFALANWKMAMTIGESLAFVEQFASRVEAHSKAMDIVICPPYTALHAVRQALGQSELHVGAQDVSTATETARTGEVSPALVADAGCEWVMLGHWEVRRHHGEDDAHVNQKMGELLPWKLRPIIFLGEGSLERDRVQEVLAQRLPHIFNDCEPEQVASAVLVYEPEWGIGQEKPAPFPHIDFACGFLRQWLREFYGPDTAEAVRIVYGGSVTPAHSKEILSSPHVDGLGVGRKGRDPTAFAEIIHSIAAAKRLHV